MYMMSPLMSLLSIRLFVMYVGRESSGIGGTRDGYICYNSVCVCAVMLIW